jgi:hypothetical protein
MQMSIFSVAIRNGVNILKTLIAGGKDWPQFRRFCSPTKDLLIVTLKPRDQFLVHYVAGPILRENITEIAELQLDA